MSKGETQNNGSQLDFLPSMPYPPFRLDDFFFNDSDKIEKEIDK
jgi:hypothetical protein